MDVSIYFSSKVKEDEIEVKCDNHKIMLKPRKIVFGIGCRRGKSKDEIKKAIEKVLDDLNMDKSRIDMLSSAEIKKDEQGILDLSDELNVSVNFVDLDRLKLFKSNDIQESDFVKSKFGIAGVCEPSALITAGFNSKLIYKKTAFDGVTVSVALGENKK
jgi:cobalt-precorrin 5A hydrolase